MDETDYRLLSVLRGEGRASISQLAAQLGITRATVRARLSRLEASGEILGYSVVLRGDVEERGVRGVTMIEIEGKGKDRIVETLGGFPEIHAVHTTNGRWDLVVELAADTLLDVDAVLNRIRLVDGIANSQTSLYLSTRRARRAAPR